MTLRINREPMGIRTQFLWNHLKITDEQNERTFSISIQEDCIKK